MILLLAVIAGLAAGLASAWWGGRRLASPKLRLVWLALVAFLPQWFCFYLPATRAQVADTWAAIALVSSQVLLLVFAWSNRRLPAFWLLCLGLAMNLVVIVLNGGLMPISPDVVARLYPNAPPGSWQIGNRLGTGKDIVLAAESARLWWLSDRFLLPDWLPYHAAYSLGDMFIGAGAFLQLWVLGGRQTPEKEERRLEKKLSLFKRPTQRQGTESAD